MESEYFKDSRFLQITLISISDFLFFFPFFFFLWHNVGVLNLMQFLFLPSKKQVSSSPTPSHLMEKSQHFLLRKYQHYWWIYSYNVQFKTNRIKLRIEKDLNCHIFNQIMKLDRTLWGSWAWKPSFVPTSLFIGNRLEPPWPSPEFQRGNSDSC